MLPAPCSLTSTGADPFVTWSGQISHLPAPSQCPSATCLIGKLPRCGCQRRRVGVAARTRGRLGAIDHEMRKLTQMKGKKVEQTSWGKETARGCGGGGNPPRRQSQGRSQRSRWSSREIKILPSNFLKISLFNLDYWIQKINDPCLFETTVMVLL
jgi:hypothetical protein